ncbi:MAG: hypothetical protein AUH41_07775 [Gemmatimonadetes bacterium 13_1_40CM_66_11]|nr:MAG: hypothetical protein AUH41_07775 [Gemmatimonadetes bacterium 13_1_40CM_66_11]
MQRIALLFVGLLALGGPRATAQQATGTTLWRVAATTLATPPALALGPSAALWNPAQTEDGARLQFGVDAIQTPSAVDATGVIATVRVPAGSLGQVGVLFGRVGLSNIAQTIDSPDPTGGVIPVYTFMAGATWSRIVARTSFGATLAFHETRLDTSRADRWTIDVGASRAVAGDRLRVAAATHFFSSFKTNDPSQDVFAGIEGRIWSGARSGDRVVVRGRYGISFAHGFAADHQFGAGAEFSKTVALDLMLAREGSYGDRGASWRPVAGVRIAIGKYRITLARDAGVNDLGSAYRVGMDARFR